MNAASAMRYAGDFAGSIPATALCALLGLTGCSTDPEPGYLYVSGPAPVVAHAPATPAVLVVFWASWCVPCREETPQLIALAKNLPAGLGIATFSHDKSLAEIEQILGVVPDQSLNLRIDPDEETAGAFGVDTLPVTFLVVGGQLQARFNGPRKWNSPSMRRLLARMIESATGPKL